MPLAPIAESLLILGLFDSLGLVSKSQSDGLILRGCDVGVCLLGDSRYTPFMSSTPLLRYCAATIRRQFTRRRLKWVGLVVAIVIAIVYLMSVWWSAHVGRVGENGSYGVWVDDGAFGVMRLRGQAEASGTVGVEFGAAEGASVQPWFDWRGYGAIVPVQIPFWFPLLLIGVPTAYLWRTDRRAKPWQCRKCRYDLRGLDGGVCPECGTPIAERSG